MIRVVNRSSVAALALLVSAACTHTPPATDAGTRAVADCRSGSVRYCERHGVDEPACRCLRQTALPALTGGSARFPF